MALEADAAHSTPAMLPAHPTRLYTTLAAGAETAEPAAIDAEMLDAVAPNDSMLMGKLLLVL